MKNQPELKFKNACNSHYVSSQRLVEFQNKKAPLNSTVVKDRNADLI
jgi:hypothetical protein